MDISNLRNRIWYRMVKVSWGIFILIIAFVTIVFINEEAFGFAEYIKMFSATLVIELCVFEILRSLFYYILFGKFKPENTFWYLKNPRVFARWYVVIISILAGIFSLDIHVDTPVGSNVEQSIGVTAILLIINVFALEQFLKQNTKKTVIAGIIFVTVISFAALFITIR